MLQIKRSKQENEFTNCNQLSHNHCFPKINQWHAFSGACLCLVFLFYCSLVQTCRLEKGNGDKWLANEEREVRVWPPVPIVFVCLLEASLHLPIYQRLYLYLPKAHLSLPEDVLPAELPTASLPLPLVWRAYPFHREPWRLISLSLSSSIKCSRVSTTTCKRDNWI